MQFQQLFKLVQGNSSQMKSINQIDESDKSCSIGDAFVDLQFEIDDF